MGTDLQDLSLRLRRRLEKELEQGERVMWLTRPRKVGVQGAGSVWLGLSLLMSVITGVLIPMRRTYGFGWWPVLASGGFAAALLLCFLYSVGPGRPVYAVTDRRALLLILGPGGDFYYWYAEDLGRRRTRAGRGGSGDIIFGQEFDTVTDSDGQAQLRRRFDGAWYGLPSVAEAETYVAALQMRGASRPKR